MVLLQSFPFTHLKSTFVHPVSHCGNFKLNRAALLIPTSLVGRWRPIACDVPNQSFNKYLPNAMHVPGSLLAANKTKSSLLGNLLSSGKESHASKVLNSSMLTPTLCPYHCLTLLPETLAGI